MDSHPKPWHEFTDAYTQISATRCAGAGAGLTAVCQDSLLPRELKEQCSSGIMFFYSHTIKQGTLFISLLLQSPVKLIPFQGVAMLHLEKCNLL